MRAKKFPGSSGSIYPHYLVIQEQLIKVKRTIEFYQLSDDNSYLLRGLYKSSSNSGWTAVIDKLFTLEITI